jgi:hypothetical protein
MLHRERDNADVSQTFVQVQFERGRHKRTQHVDGNGPMQKDQSAPFLKTDGPSIGPTRGLKSVNCHVAILGDLEP